MKLVVLRLANHTDVIGQLMNETENQFTLDGTMMLVSRFEPGQPAPVVYMSRYNPYSHTWRVTFDRKHVIHDFRDITEHVEEYYFKLLREAMRPSRQRLYEEMEELAQEDEETDEETEAMMAFFEKAISNTEIH